MKKFDYIIGNPPYQDDSIGENKNFAPPIYHYFMDGCREVSEKVELITPARFLFNAGRTPREWNQKMLSDPHFKVLDYEPDACKIFPGTEIKGGVVICYLDAVKEFEPVGVFTPYPELNAILHRTGPVTEQDSLASCIYVQNRFDLTQLYKDHPEYRKIIGSNGNDKRFRNNIFDKVHLFTDQETATSIPVLGVIQNKRTWRCIPRKYVECEHENLYKWKVLIVRVNGSGQLGEALSKPVIIGPGKGYTQTFIGLGAFEDEATAINALKYIKSKFARAMLGVLKITQDNNRATWRYVPKQDFTKESDIDWSKSVAGIDQQLYKKYGLSDEEIEFIETHVKEMV